MSVRAVYIFMFWPAKMCFYFFLSLLLRVLFIALLAKRLCLGLLKKVAIKYSNGKLMLFVVTCLIVNCAFYWKKCLLSLANPWFLSNWVFPFWCYHVCCSLSYSETIHNHTLDTNYQFHPFFSIHFFFGDAPSISDQLTLHFLLILPF